MMSQKIDLDHGRFRQIIRGKIKQNLRKYISQGEMIAKKGKDTVSIPLPQVDIPHFKHGDKQQGGVGQGEGEPGDALGQGEEQPGAGQRPAIGRAITCSTSRSRCRSSPRSWARSSSCRASSRKGTEKIVAYKDKYSGIRTTGPESLRHFRRTYRAGDAPADRDGHVRRRRTRSSSRSARTSAIAVWRSEPLPQSNAVIIYMMDVSGSMGDEQKEIVRIESFWIDTWLRSQYHGIESRYIIHDAMAKEVDRDTFFKTRERGGTMISSAYKLCAKLIDDEYPPTMWNIYPFHFSDGDNWSVDDTHTCVELLKKDVLPYVNLFCYGQVESPYGSGQFIKDLTEHFDEDERVVTARDQGQGRDHGLDQGVPREGQVSMAAQALPRVPARHPGRDRGLRARTTASTSSRSSTRSSTTRR